MTTDSSESEKGEYCSAAEAIADMTGKSVEEFEISNHKIPDFEDQKIHPKKEATKPKLER